MAKRTSVPEKLLELDLTSDEDEPATRSRRRNVAHQAATDVLSELKSKGAIGRQTRSGRVPPARCSMKLSEDDNDVSNRRQIAKKRKREKSRDHESKLENATTVKMDELEAAVVDSYNINDQEPSCSAANDSESDRRRRKPVLSAEEVEADKRKRLDFLLKQSEDFARMMTSGGTAEKTVKKGRKRANKSSTSRQFKDHRHAKHDNEDEDDFEKMELDTSAVCRYEKTPSYIKGGEMRDYQIRGLNWLISLCENGINGILADEMGLGKTLQTISLLGYYHLVKRSDKPDLVIVPKSTISNWLNEFKRWCPALTAVSLIGDPDVRKEFIKKSLRKRTWNVLITSYDFAFREGTFLRKFVWGYVIIDEAHRIKNEQGVLSQAVRKFSSSRRLLLTGTPLQNNLHELWALLNFLLPDIFESADDFDSWFNEKSCVTDLSLVERLHAILRPFLLRRVKADVEKNLPSKTEIKLTVGLTEMQRTWYRNVLLKDVSLLNSAASASYVSLHNTLMHLRKVCNHPYLFQNAEPGPPYTTEQHIIDNCGKMILLDKLLVRLKEGGHRVLLFSQMTRVLDILEDYCTWKEHEYCRLDGSTSHEDREEAIQSYNAVKSKKFIFLLSTRAGGLGINLTSADTVILYDSDWNPQVDLQAMDRVHRIGQTKPVTVFRLITENTVEERIIERAERKLRLDVMIIQSGRLVDSASNRLEKDALLKMIRHGAQAIIHSNASDMTDEDIDTILERGKQKTEENNKKLSDLTEDTLRGLTYDYVEKDLFNFEGEDYRAKQNPAREEPEQQWIDLPKRERRQINTDLSRSMGSSRESPPWVPKVPKKPSIPRPPVYRFIDIQFASPRLVQLLDREQLVYKKAIGFKVDSDPGLEEAIRERQLTEQAKIDNAEPLTPAEQHEKQTLLKSCFLTWRRNDFMCLLRGLEAYGPSNPEKIATFVESKSTEEVKTYLSFLLKNYQKLADAPRIAARINKGITSQEKQRMRREAVKQKIASTQFPAFDLKIPYPSGYLKSHNVGLGISTGNPRVQWLEEEDRFVVCAYAEACHFFPDDGEALFEHIRDEIRRAPNFRFDYMIRAITTDRVKERLDTLLGWIVKDVNPKPAISLGKVIPNKEQLLHSADNALIEPAALKEAITKLTLLPSKDTTSKGLKKVKLAPEEPSTSSGIADQSPSNTTFTLKHVDFSAGKFVMVPQEQAPIKALSPTWQLKTPVKVAPIKFDTKKSHVKKSGDSASKPIPNWARPKGWKEHSGDASSTSGSKTSTSSCTSETDSSSDSDVVLVYEGKK